MKALAILVNNLVYADLVHRDYSPEFQQIGDTITVRNPATLVAKDFAGQIEKPRYYRRLCNCKIRPS